MESTIMRSIVCFALLTFVGVFSLVVDHKDDHSRNDMMAPNHLHNAGKSMHKRSVYQSYEPKVDYIPGTNYGYKSEYKGPDSSYEKHQPDYTSSSYDGYKPSYDHEHAYYPKDGYKAYDAHVPSYEKDYGSYGKPVYSEDAYTPKASPHDYKKSQYPGYDQHYDSSKSYGSEDYKKSQYPGYDKHDSSKPYGSDGYKGPGYAYVH